VQSSELDVDGLAARGKAAATQYRRRRGDGSDDAGTGHRVLDDVAHSRYRVADHFADDDVPR
jgi:hypothetical protein